VNVPKDFYSTSLVTSNEIFSRQVSTGTIPSLMDSENNRVDMSLIAEDIVDTVQPKEVLNVICVQCNREIAYQEYLIHRRTCVEMNDVERKLKEITDLFRRKLQVGENDNDLLCHYEDNCFFMSG
jgi:hypothetical protein